MTREEIRSKLTAVVVKEYDVTEEQINKYPNLYDLGLDSLSVIDLWLRIEDMFKIDIEEFEMRNCKTSDDLLNLIEKKMKRG